MKMHEVQVGVLHHKHGCDIFIGWTEEAVHAKVYEYIKEWWSDFCDAEALPADHMEALRAYFEAAGGEEYLDMMADELPCGCGE